jgi:hypothetical protein
LFNDLRHARASKYLHIAIARHSIIVHVPLNRIPHRRRIVSLPKGCRAGTVQLQASQALHHPGCLKTASSPITSD